MEEDDDLSRKEDFEAVCKQIERDDPKMEELSIIHDHFSPTRGEWERVGRAIGSNTHIKELIFPDDLEYYYDDLGGEDEFAAFCKSFACNKSIERLVVNCLDLFDGKIFGMLSPFLKQNRNLRCMWVDYDRCEPDKLRFLSETLKEFNNLKDFRLTGMGGINPETALRALKGHSQLSVISLFDADFFGSTAAALESLFIEHRTSLIEFDLSYGRLDSRGEKALVNAFANFRALKKCNLSHIGPIETDGWVDILYGMSRLLNSSLEELALSCTMITDVAVDYLAEAARKCTHLRTLKLDLNRQITAEEWQSLFPILLGPSSMLQELDLGSNDFTDEVITSLTECLTNNCTLESLDLGCNLTVTPSGWIAFSAVLRNTGSALKTVDIRLSSIDEVTLATYAESLISNCMLEQLIIYGSVNRHEIVTGINALLPVLCNKTSIVNTFHSNHTLQTISPPGESLDDNSSLPRDLITFLQINRNHSRAEAARRKIIDVHFTGDFSMKPFLEMNRGILPHALAWMAKDGYGRSLLYEFLRSTNLFFEVGLEMESVLGPRQKRLKTK